MAVYTLRIPFILLEVYFRVPYRARFPIGRIAYLARPVLHPVHHCTPEGYQLFCSFSRTYNHPDALNIHLKDHQ
ncbi:hypothetical protein AMELA_G00105390 [Ameiurus melas]|uniref:Uncharacterized protein n=1 Tax=Ameiurus melas TaxID=219545 RepID=A0A7J6AU75_AMEME|nr:hypothetical protein AMELA_G00105390 [Ameiurus melas]